MNGGVNFLTCSLKIHEFEADSLPEEVTWTASARVLVLRRLRLRGVSQFSGYRKFTVDTSTTYRNPQQ